MTANGNEAVRARDEPDGSRAADSPTIKTRDAGNTRRLLLTAARTRFARDGYSATTVRDIAADANVNVALINRYFASKEGLFEACLNTVEELDALDETSSTLEQMIQNMAARVAELPSDSYPLQLLLLLRSSGDEKADAIRRSILHSYSERIAATAGWSPDDESSEHLLLRAQIALATSLGIVLLRSSSGLEPLSSASAGELTDPLGDLLASLLEPPSVQRE
ncbi:TetR family transcriptional regulator [Subtercola sp. PAMC28395]|uniref:TetR/AcrR family transcriptional regulator n=1 Tax=Subtercola sp. PAMC28395 TaxID=2846775 RepID=UPI001C0E0F5D|nr:TetR/AcrR family transcriptional regulator [Subtercola sp. PAMC28395]QWT22661.1 TetR family transcriptional regulator [Subtercola sp. PAMC28395]